MLNKSLPNYKNLKSEKNILFDIFLLIRKSRGKTGEIQEINRRITGEIHGKLIRINKITIEVQGKFMANIKEIQGKKVYILEK